MKIAWRIIKNPQLLMSNLLAAKYCKNENLFEARMSALPSRIWRGVMRRFRLFIEGVWWDDQRAEFRWKFASNGAFSVKSAYEMIVANDGMGDRAGVQRSSQDKNGLHRFWKKIWTAKVPNKVKVCCWRRFHDSLPDGKNLWRRGIGIDIRCMMCGNKGESARHVVNKYKFIGFISTWIVSRNFPLSVDETIHRNARMMARLDAWDVDSDDLNRRMESLRIEIDSVTRAVAVPPIQRASARHRLTTHHRGNR